MGSTGTITIIRCYYGLATGDKAVTVNGAVPDPLNADTPGGHYHGTITFTIVPVN